MNDLSWAPLYGRSYHLLVSADSHKENPKIIVWKLKVKDLFAEQMFETPIVEKLAVFEHLTH